MTQSRRVEGAERAALVLAFCATPRTQVEIKEHFGDDKHWVFTVHGLVRREKLRNLVGGKRRPGKFQAAEVPAPEPEAAPEAERVPDPAGRSRAWAKLEALPRVSSVWALGALV